MPNMYKIVTVHANAEKIVTWKCIWCQIYTKYITLKANVQRKSSLWKCIWHHICTKSLLWRHMLRKSFTVKCMLAPHMYKTITLKANAQEINYLQMHLAPNMYKIVTLKANAKGIMYSVKCVWHQICTKTSLWREMLRKSCHFKMHAWHQICTKSVTLKTNAKEIVTWKCFWQPNMYKTVTLNGKW